jgi:N-acetylglucosamine-6-phosphate deacetylase
VLSLADKLWISFIADGAHIPLFALSNYLKATGLDRVVIVTDAIAAAGQGPGQYRLAGRIVDVGEDGVPRCDDPSHLVGSGTIMSRMAGNLRTHLKLTDAQIERLTQENPRRILRNTPQRGGR